jgi:hypothetical protein
MRSAEGGVESRRTTAGAVAPVSIVGRERDGAQSISADTEAAETVGFYSTVTLLARFLG